MEFFASNVTGATSDPQFYCDVYFPGLAPAAGSFTSPDVASCELVITHSVSSGDFWEHASGFELTITSPGPAYTVSLPADKMRFGVSLTAHSP